MWARRHLELQSESLPTLVKLSSVNILYLLMINISYFWFLKHCCLHATSAIATTHLTTLTSSLFVNAYHAGMITELYGVEVRLAIVLSRLTNGSHVTCLISLLC